MMVRDINFNFCHEPGALRGVITYSINFSSFLYKVIAYMQKYLRYLKNYVKPLFRIIIFSIAIKLSFAQNGGEKGYWLS